jgi:hypothetical protein
VNQRGREHLLGAELERVAGRAGLAGVRYLGYDFHGRCHSLNWAHLAVLRADLRPELDGFG